jgi:hypothetical protein
MRRIVAVGWLVLAWTSLARPAAAQSAGVLVIGLVGQGSRKRDVSLLVMVTSSCVAGANGTSGITRRTLVKLVSPP